jgi:hypothetical protein
MLLSLSIRYTWALHAKKYFQGEKITKVSIFGAFEALLGIAFEKLFK